MPRLTFRTSSKVTRPPRFKSPLAAWGGGILWLLHYRLHSLLRRERTVYVHANMRLMDKTSDVDYEEANVDWMMSSDCDSDYQDSRQPV